MHKTRATLMLPFLCLAACAGQGPDEPAAPVAPEPARFTEELPIELVRYFAGDGDVHDDLPPGFPPVRLPEGLRPLIAQDGDRVQRVMFSAEGDLAEARDALADAILESEGWRELSSSFIPGFRPVFPLPQARIFSRVPARELCHDEYGSLRIQPDDANAVLSLNRTLVQRRPGGWCELEEMARERSRAFTREDAIQRAMPSLELPPGEIEPLSLASRATDRTSGIALSGARESLRSLASHFARQLEEQGWSRDAQWRGRVGAGSTWLKPVEQEGRQALGTLTIHESGDEHFNIVFRARLIGNCQEAQEAQDAPNVIGSRLPSTALYLPLEPDCGE